MAAGARPANDAGMVAGRLWFVSRVREGAAPVASAMLAAVAAAAIAGCSSDRQADAGEAGGEPPIAASSPEPIELEEAEQRADADTDPLEDGAGDGDGAGAEPADPERIDRVTLSGGLVIEDLMEGHGPMLSGSEGVTVTVHYRGMVQGGEGGEGKRIFDSTYDRGEPVALELGRLIRGWRQGLPGMRIGGMRRLTIPPELAYGSEGYRDVPGGSTVVYEVLLLGFSPTQN